MATRPPRPSKAYIERMIKKHAEESAQRAHPVDPHHERGRCICWCTKCKRQVAWQPSLFYEGCQEAVLICTCPSGCACPSRHHAA